MASTSAAKGALKTVVYSPLHVHLKNFPRTTTPADIRRLLSRHRVGEQVTDVALEHRRFWATGGAYLTFAGTEAQRHALKVLRDASFFTKTIHALQTPVPEGPPKRTRGIRGRETAVGRGAVAGSGERGGIWETGRSVILAGLPGKATANEVRSMLKGYKLANGTSQVVKLDRINDSVISRVLVRLNSASEAHRLVRNVHMTYMDQEHLGSEYLVHARIVL